MRFHGAREQCVGLYSFEGLHPAVKVKVEELYPARATGCTARSLYPDNLRT